MTQPYVFISHKHVEPDRSIAEALARFVRRSTAAKVSVHLSSSTEFEGPRLGKNINSELKNALAQTDVVLLVFTSATADWSYCMWECGVATDPTDTKPTAVVVVQCGTEEPKPYSDELRVIAADPASIETLVKALLTTTDLFAQFDEPVTAFAADGPDVKQFATELHSTLTPLLALGGGSDRTTPAAPFIRVQVAPEGVAQLRSAADDNSGLASLGEALKTEAKVIDHERVEELFRMRIDDNTTLGEIVEKRAATDPDAMRWFASLVGQFKAAFSGLFRAVPWAPYSSEAGKSDVPVVASSREVAGGSFEFDVYFVPIAPRPVPVKEKMLPIAQTFHKSLKEVSLGAIPLLELVKEMSDLGYTRVPVLNEAGAPLLLVHKATINGFLVQNLTQERDAKTLSMEDLAGAEELGETLRERSFAVVAPDATMEEALAAMEAIPGCQDVFVTENGQRDGTVAGWLTNVMFIDSAPAAARE